MSLEPLYHAPLIVQAHVATVVPAFLLAIWLIVFSRKGSRLASGARGAVPDAHGGDGHHQPVHSSPDAR
jgi:uncharacterized membrane protein